MSAKEPLAPSGYIKEPFMNPKNPTTLREPHAMDKEP